MYIPSLLTIKNFISFKEQVFEFRNGEAVMIVGDNQDQLSQKGNGAGKSAFIEAMAVAITGKPLRDCLTKELIFNEQGCCEISLVLTNAILGHALTINRALYSDTTPAGYGALINAIDQGKYYADWNQFNDWIFKQIGISKTDFFGNYLITRDNYEPFLRIGDTKKKEIVNRYSGANVVDKVFPQILADSSKLGVEIEELNQQLISNKAKQEVFADQVEELNKASDPDEIEQQVTEVEGIIKEKREEQEEFKNQRTELNTAILKLEKDIKAFKYTKDFTKLISQVTQQSEKKTTEVKTLTQSLDGVKAKFKSKATAINTEEEELKTEKQELLDTLKEYEEFESEINKHLTDEIECPKCKHLFCLRDKDYNIEGAKEALPKVVESIAGFKLDLEEINKKLNSGIQQKRTALNSEINKAQEKINEQIKNLNQEINTLAQQNRTLQDEKRTEDEKKRGWETDLSNKQRILKALNQDIEELDTIIGKLNDDINDIKNPGTDTKRLDELTKSIERLVKEEENLKNAWEIKRKEKERIDTWELNFIKFKSHLANKSIKNIQDYTNVFLEQMGSDLSIEMSGYRPLANKKKIKEEINTIVKRNGFPAGSYGKFSGGERGRIDISVILSNQELINLNCEHGKGLSFLGIDEILDQVDALGLELIIDSLQYLNKTIMIVSQQVDINNISEHTLIVRKKGGISKLVTK